MKFLKSGEKIEWKFGGIRDIMLRIRNDEG